MVNHVCPQLYNEKDLFVKHYVLFHCTRLNHYEARSSWLWFCASGREKSKKLNYRENNWIYGIALNFSPGVHKNKRIIIYMAFMKYKTIGMTEILIDGGLSRINKTEGLLIYSHPLQQCHNFISFQSLLNHFLKLKLKQKITLGVKFPIHTLSWRPVKVT